MLGQSPHMLRPIIFRSQETEQNKTNKDMCPDITAECATIVTRLSSPYTEESLVGFPALLCMFISAHLVCQMQHLLLLQLRQIWYSVSYVLGHFSFLIGRDMLPPCLHHLLQAQPFSFVLFNAAPSDPDPPGYQCMLFNPIWTLGFRLFP